MGDCIGELLSVLIRWNECAFFMPISFLKFNRIARLGICPFGWIVFVLKKPLTSFGEL
jgi:hypothetical protein